MKFSLISVTLALTLLVSMVAVADAPIPGKDQQGQPCSLQILDQAPTQPGAYAQVKVNYYVNPIEVFPEIGTDGKPDFSLLRGTVVTKDSQGEITAALDYRVQEERFLFSETKVSWDRRIIYSKNFECLF